MIRRFTLYLTSCDPAPHAFGKANGQELLTKNIGEVAFEVWTA